MISAPEKSVRSKRIVEYLLQKKLLTVEQVEEIEKFRAEIGWSFAKICLTYGYVSRRKWSEILKEIGFEIVDLKNQKIDKGIVSYLNLLIMDQYLGVPIRRENGKVVV
ncbi:MAG: hypothetical protein ABDI07_10840, partial [Candidatus Kryptonium sp.]